MKQIGKIFVLNKLLMKYKIFKVGNNEEIFLNNFHLNIVDKMKKLPKGLKTWPAFSELKKKLDNFNECLPLLELLINPAMQVTTNSPHRFPKKSFLRLVSSLGTNRK